MALHQLSDDYEVKREQSGVGLVLKLKPVSAVVQQINLKMVKLIWNDN